MGLMDRARDVAQQTLDGREQRAADQSAAQAELERKEYIATGGCPDPDNHYVTRVNKDSINMGHWQAKLNQMVRQGYRLAHVFEQHGNTIQVFEHRGH